ncbi:hypothetical protein RCO28_34645 [Streptomyces sp. LHD-70]|uniref:hypothetical protein n=1 Tax=Streptomyces sp. LHD-70 TaxID=3072140 RepID=UPI00280EEF95|nr:hypothetical protein [Streptomyces sp. LHD-70]MDQ8707573.1 hypothetical protein [Streptomyces sp. LHD-70]
MEIVPETIAPSGRLNGKVESLLVPRVYQPQSFAGFLARRLNMTPEFEASNLSAEQVADLALLATAHAGSHAPTARLISLMSSLPVPSDEPRDFWFELWQVADNPILLPGNLRGQLLRAVEGDGVALADQLLTVVSGMNTEQRAAAAEVIGKAIGTDYLAYEASYIGELWLRDVESAAWQILHAYQCSGTWEEQQEFVQAWKDA